MVMTLRGDTLYDSREYKKNTGMTLRIRGNTTYEDKKSYDLILKQKTDLFFREDKEWLDKSWTLLRVGNKCNTIIGLYLNQLLEMPWTPRCKAVNFILNGDYKGLYYLIEDISA